MKRNIIRNMLGIIILILFIPMISSASEIVTGKIVGINSLTNGKEAPIDADDPHVALEPDFVIRTSEGDHYLIPLIPRVLKVRYLYQTVKVTGDINKEYKSITVDKLQVKKKEKYKTIWNKKRWEEEQAYLYKLGP